jgi:hypothetical protein
VSGTGFVLDTEDRSPGKELVAQTAAGASVASGLSFPALRRYRGRVVELPPYPSEESLQARLAATREKAHRLMKLNAGREVMGLARQALDDLDDAERLLAEPSVGEKPHALRAVDACLEVAEWRLRGVTQIIDDWE